MDEINAWESFEATGSVQDYLIYCGYKHYDGKRLTGVIEDANQDRWYSSNGAEYWGKRQANHNFDSQGRAH